MECTLPSARGQDSGRAQRWLTPVAGTDALEATKQGSAAVGLRSKTHVVLLALKVCKKNNSLKLNHLTASER